VKCVAHVDSRKVDLTLEIETDHLTLEIERTV